MLPGTVGRWVVGASGRPARPGDPPLPPLAAVQAALAVSLTEMDLAPPMALCKPPRRAFTTPRPKGQGKAKAKGKP